MDSSESGKRIFDIFNDLKNDRITDGKTINLIDKSRKLIPDKKIGGFQADKSKNEIKYNPDYFHDAISNYDDNLIRFILLHEEAHISISKSRIRRSFYLLMGIVFFFTIIIYFYQLSIRINFQETSFEIPSMISAISFLFICLLIGIPAIWRYQWDVMFEDELTADYYGAECLSKYFNDPDPSKTVSPYFIMEDSSQEKERIARKKRMMKLCGVYPDYHPSNYERVAKIQDNFHPSEKSN